MPEPPAVPSTQRYDPGTRVLPPKGTAKCFIWLRAVMAASLLTLPVAPVLGADPATSAPQDDLSNSVNSLQRKYSKVHDLQMDFIQTYKSPHRLPRTETGALYLRRPGMMRWEYRSPTEKLFVSNGKDVYFYLPEEQQVQKTTVKGSRDQRLPFLFLLGKGNLKRDFSRVEWATNERAFYAGNKVLYAYPKRNIDEFSKVLMEYDPRKLQLQRVIIYDIDGASSEFVFTNIRENLGLDSRLFEFKIPPNVEVIGAEAYSAQ
jgi:outer membrane lipoprotein carrier protein